MFPYKECFCADGWYGDQVRWCSILASDWSTVTNTDLLLVQCQHASVWGVDQATKVDTAAFTRLELGQGAELLYRVAGEGQQTSDMHAMFDNIKNEETASRIINH